MNYCVEVATKTGLRDARAENLKGQIELLGIPGIDSVDIADRYYLSGSLRTADLDILATTLLHDQIVETARSFSLDTDTVPDGERAFTVDVVLHPGVTDSPESW